MKRKITLTERQLRNIIKKIIIEVESDKETKSNFGFNEPEFYSLETMDDDDINDTNKTSSVEKNSENVIFVAGVTTKKSFEQQIELLKKGVGTDKNIIPFQWRQWESAIKSIKKYPNSYVVLYSMGGQNANSIAIALKESGGDLTKMYIIESPKSFSDVEKAIETGVPKSNVLAGPWPGRGLGVYNDDTSHNRGEKIKKDIYADGKYGNHFQALERFSKEKIGN